MRSRLKQTHLQITAVQSSLHGTIAGTRITLYDVLDHFAAGWTPKLILNWLPLTEHLNAALFSIDFNRTEVEAEYQMDGIVIGAVSIELLR